MSRPNMRTAWLLVADALRDVAEWYEVAEAVAYAVDVPPGEWPAVAAAIRAMCGPDEDEAPAGDVLTDLRALLALDWPVLVYVPDDGWQEPACNLDTFQTAVDSLIEESVDGWAEDAESTMELSCVPRRRLTLVHRDLDPDSYEAGRMRAAGWDYIADGVVVEHPDLRATMVAAAEEIERLRADAPPPADVSLQALANRTLTADLEAARADVRRVIAERDEARRNYQFMVERAADRHLGGYRELAAKCAASEAERDEARSRAARLTRILAVERGDQTQAPVGWQRYGDAAWRIPGPGGVVIQRACDGMLDTWIRRGVLRDDPRCRVWSTALEAMEAIDAERGGVSDG